MLVYQQIVQMESFSQTTGNSSRIEINYVSFLMFPSWYFMAGAILINFESVRKLLPNRGRILVAKPTQTFSLGGNHFQCFMKISFSNDFLNFQLLNLPSFQPTLRSGLQWFLARFENAGVHFIIRQQLYESSRPILRQWCFSQTF